METTGRQQVKMINRLFRAKLVLRIGLNITWALYQLVLLLATEVTEHTEVFCLSLRAVARQSPERWEISPFGRNDMVRFKAMIFKNLCVLCALCGKKNYCCTCYDTTRLTSRPGTTITLRTVLSAMLLIIFSSCNAMVSINSLSAFGNLPFTCTTSSTSSLTSAASS